MLFVPSKGGVSHSPAEDTDPYHLGLGVEALLGAVLRLSVHSW
jgi:acetylornithine deacetylase/succinyl-diaminopimelate desuccinylase-like protein